MAILPGPLTSMKPHLAMALSLAALFSPPAPGEAQVPVDGWQVAGPYPATQVARDAYPNFYAIFLAPWKAVGVGDTGLLDLAQHVPREHTGRDLVLARVSFLSHEEKVINLNLEYAQGVDLFFNGWRVFSGRRPHLLQD